MSLDAPSSKPTEQVYAHYEHVPYPEEHRLGLIKWFREKFQDPYEQSSPLRAKLPDGIEQYVTVPIDEIESVSDPGLRGQLRLQIQLTSAALYPFAYPDDRWAGSSFVIRRESGDNE